MKQIPAIILFVFSAIGSLAQTNTTSPEKSSKLHFALNLGSTFTFVPDSKHTIISLPEGVVIPNYVHPANGKTVVVNESNASSKAKMGWSAALEFSYELNHNYAWHFSAGVKKLNFDYTVTFVDPTGTYYPDPVNLDDLNSEFGNTNLTYLTIDPAISKSFFNKRLRVKLGPTLNWLMDDKTNNILKGYFTPQEPGYDMPDEVFFDTTGKPQDLLWGANATLSYQVMPAIDVNLSGQFMFNSIYESRSLFETGDVESVKPFVLAVGVTLRPLEF